MENTILPTSGSPTRGGSGNRLGKLFPDLAPKIRTRMVVEELCAKKKCFDFNQGRAKHGNVPW